MRKRREEDSGDQVPQDERLGAKLRMEQHDKRQCIVVVTGGSSGMGREMVGAFARNGDRAVVIDWTEDAFATDAQAIDDHCTRQHADISQPDQVRSSHLPGSECRTGEPADAFMMELDGSTSKAPPAKGKLPSIRLLQRDAVCHAFGRRVRPDCCSCPSPFIRPS